MSGFLELFYFFRDYFIFISENGHTLDTFSLYDKYQIVDELTISPPHKKIVKKLRREPGLLHVVAKKVW